MRPADRPELDQSRLRAILGPDTFLYVNYPFCSKLCAFCIYKLHPYSEVQSSQFLADLAQEVSLLSDRLGGFRFRNLHVGGGTPNLVPADALLGSLEPLVDFASLERFVVETSPRAGFKDYVLALREHKVTKVQLGVQTLNPEILDQEGRDTTEGTILSCVEALAGSGLVWSVDLIYGFAGEEQLGRDHLRELDTLLEFDPMGFHLYLMRSEAANRFYGKPRTGAGPDLEDRKKSWDVQAFEEAEDRLIEAGYRRIYDEYCKGPNLAHAERTVSYDARTGFLPNMVGIGVGAATHTRIMQYDNVRNLARYGQLLQQGRMPHEGGVDYEQCGMFPIAMIYFKVRHGAPVDIPRLSDSLGLSEFETRQVDRLLEELARRKVRYRLNRGLLSIPQGDYSLALSAITEHLKAGSKAVRESADGLPGLDIFQGRVRDA